MLPPGVALRHWGELERHLRPGVPEGCDPEATLAGLREQVRAGRLDVWAVECGREIRAVATTRFSQDFASGDPVLLLGTISGIGLLPREAFETLLGEGRAMAEAGGAKRIVAYSRLPHVISIAEKMGADTDLRVIVLEV